MFPTLVRRTAEKATSSLLRNTASTALKSASTGPYKLKKVWPPDFTKLSEKDQFRFERRYKRRLKLATVRPRWDKFIKLAQLFSMISVLIYTVLFMDWEQENNPFQGIRDRFWDFFGALTPEQRHQRRTPDIEAITNRKQI
ncbi:uncharacterized protein GGS22DRAFT_144272 [Annulohypoxylon maeteangense]|uniref:uncharacterized protein n=1 Tax=Annulohypoxylon maeteangense TaxID=1927788 RepID=UPI002007F0D6|nr:uncharacterized protein GGS22DRAFT_144272 [Annulohypoxylon maeteangense]KAI0884577.1 hypothetical protein GGS22DRAFT_144272 [Annulohypoxylon maeteangense]